MPIQVVTTYKKIPPPPVDLTTAGSDVFPFCDVEIFLEATVTPLINLQGHTILWEQLSGTPVILISPTTIGTSYIQLVNDNTDKEFKITIDKGELNQQSDTVIVYATPTAITTNTFSSSQTTRYTPFDVVICSSIEVNSEAIIPPPAFIINPDVIWQAGFLISWELPTDPLLAPYLTRMDLYENDVYVASFLPGDVLEYHGGPNEYYVISYFVVEGQPSDGTSCTQDFSDVAVPLVRVSDDAALTTFIDSDVSILKYLNLLQRPTTIKQSNFSTSDGFTLRFINTYKEGISLRTSNLTTSALIITRTSSGGIGGG